MSAVDRHKQWDKDDLRTKRAVADMSQQQLAAYVGVSLRCVQKWEQGINRIPFMLALAWREVLVKHDVLAELRLDRAKQKPKFRVGQTPPPENYQWTKDGPHWHLPYSGDDAIGTFPWDPKGKIYYNHDRQEWWWRPWDQVESPPDEIRTWLKRRPEPPAPELTWAERVRKQQNNPD